VFYRQKNSVVICIFIFILLSLASNACFGSNLEEEYLLAGVENAIQGRFKEAKMDFNKSLEVSNEPKLNNANVYLQIIEDAINQKIKEETATYIFKGMNHISRWDVNEGMAELDKAIFNEPEYKYGYFLRGINYATIILDHEKAIFDLKKVLELDPQFAFAYYNIAYEYKNIDNKTEAIKAFKNFIKYAPPEDEYFIKDAEEKIRELEK